MNYNFTYFLLDLAIGHLSRSLASVDGEGGASIGTAAPDLGLIIAVSWRVIKDISEPNDQMVPSKKSCISCVIATSRNCLGSLTRRQVQLSH